MSSEPFNPRSSLTDPALRLAPRKPAGVLSRAAGAVDAALEPLDRFKDGLAGTLGRAALAVEQQARGSRFGDTVQFFNGAAAAFAAMAEGTYQTIRHPIRTIEGLVTLAGHVPLSPVWLFRLVKEGPGTALAGDKVFWKALVAATFEPFVKDWTSGRQYAAVGRAAVEIGMLYLSARQAKQAYDAWKGRRAAGAAIDDVAKARPAAEESLQAAVLGDEPRVTGQVVPEGEVVVGAKRARGMSTEARDELHRAMDAFKGDRRAARRRALEQFRSQRDNEGFSAARRSIEARRDMVRYRKLQQVGPKRLMADETVQRRYRLLTHSVDRRVDQELQQIIGIVPEGSPKRPVRAAAKLELKRAENMADLRLGDLDDLARGRINLPRHDAREIRAILKKLKAHYGDDNLIVKDYLQGKPYYKGRLHVKIRDGSGLWYELQVGSRQLTTFFDSEFTLHGRTVNMHDAVYKGLLMLEDDAIKVLGKGSVRAGTKRMAEVLNRYVDELDGALLTARRGEAYDFARRTEALRARLADLFDEIPEPLMPIGLQG